MLILHAYTGFTITFNQDGFIGRLWDHWNRTLRLLILGAARGWDAASGFTHHLSNTSMERFLPEPYKPEPGVYKR